MGKLGRWLITGSLNSCSLCEKKRIPCDVGYKPESRDVTLEGVHFKVGSDSLSASARQILKSVANTLRKHSRMRVEIAGHTDNTGPVEINRQLSLQRARAATEFLIDLGVSKDVLKTRGYAANQPVASNDTPEGRLANRRAEMRFIEID